MTILFRSESLIFIDDTLQAKMRELERKYELQAIKHEELTLEMTQLRVQAERFRLISISSSSNQKQYLAISTGKIRTFFVSRFPSEEKSGNPVSDTRKLKPLNHH